MRFSSITISGNKKDSHLPKMIEYADSRVCWKICKQHDWSLRSHRDPAQVEMSRCTVSWVCVIVYKNGNPGGFVGLTDSVATWCSDSGQVQTQARCRLLFVDSLNIYIFSHRYGSPDYTATFNGTATTLWPMTSLRGLIFLNGEVQSPANS